MRAIPNRIAPDTESNVAISAMIRVPVLSTSATKKQAGYTIATLVAVIEERKQLSAKYASILETLKKVQIAVR
jgi:hypothetical protein